MQLQVSRVYISDMIKGWMFSLNMDNFTKENIGVLERSGDISRDLSRMHGYIVRKGSFDINGLYAEEIRMMTSEPSNNEAKYSFSLYINEKTASYKFLGLAVDLNNISYYTQEERMTYTQEEIITFGDAIIHTVHLRPNAF